MMGKVDATLPDWRRVARPPDAPTALGISLSPELMAEASRRLGWLGVTYAVASIVTHFGHRALLLLNGSTDVGLRAADALGLSTVALAFAVYAVSRRGLLSHERLLELGFVFQVVGAIDIAGTRAWTAVLQTPDAMWGLVPAECVWIVVYPLVVPSVPRKALLASLIAASPGPAAVVLAATFGGAVIDRPAAIAIYYVMTTYTCAVSAYAVSRMVYGLRLRLKRAREIGSYELIDKIGEGGMGEVWRARHRLLARPAAIKLIRRRAAGLESPDARGGPPALRTRSARDRRAPLDPTRSTSTTSASPKDGDFYYVMELLDGISLERSCERFGPMEPARVAYRAATGLPFARRGARARSHPPRHQAGEHLPVPARSGRRLRQGAGLRAGQACPRSAGHDADAGGRNRRHAGLHGAGNRARQVRWTDAPTSTRSGASRTTCSPAQPVFSHQSALATVLAHVQEDPVPPSERSEFEIPPALEALTLQCLAKDPAARPASASELGDRLAATVAPAAWTTQAARRWWELHYPHPHPSAAHDADGRGGKHARHRGKESRRDEISTHTPVHTLAPALFPADEA